jgi:hypothetical protein
MLSTLIYDLGEAKGKLCNQKKGVEIISPNYKLLSLDIQTLCNNSCSLYPANSALLQYSSATILTEHDSPFPCESPDGTYMSVSSRLL